jgi:hypothetical protein
MRKGGRIFILLGVTLALAAAVLAIVAFRDTEEPETDVAAEVIMVEVIEAAEDIPVNHVLTEDDIRVVEVDETTVSPGTARSTGQVLGLASSGEIVSGQRVLMANLVTPGLSHIVEDGMRAVALPIDRENALGGMIRAEDRIDLNDVKLIAWPKRFEEALRERACAGADFEDPPWAARLAEGARHRFGEARRGRHDRAGLLELLEELAHEEEHGRATPRTGNDMPKSGSSLRGSALSRKRLMRRQRRQRGCSPRPFRPMRRRPSDPRWRSGSASFD